ncbi:unnamed protein product [Allacma fusca]|uniref:SAP domain-containing protein n=1 Tax=Allacma fusca TaxID=39272 RepID=A0A8J2P678_9HEXA|nr:unnamed protein product [Allacma fusca]
MSQQRSSRCRKKLCDLSLDSLVRHLKKRGLDPNGPKNVLQARLVVALKRERGLLENDTMSRTGVRVEIESPLFESNADNFVGKMSASLDKPKNPDNEDGLLHDDESPTFIINAENSDQDTCMTSLQQEHCLNEAVDVNFASITTTANEHRSRESKESAEEEEGEFSSKNSIQSSHTPTTFASKQKDDINYRRGCTGESGDDVRESRDRRVDIRENRDSIRSCISRDNKKTSRSTSTASHNSSSRSISHSHDTHRSLQKAHSSSKSCSSVSSSKYESKTSSIRRSTSRRVESQQRYREHVHRYAASKQHRVREQQHRYQAEHYERRCKIYPPQENLHKTQDQVEALQNENRRLKLDREKLAREKEELLRREYERQRVDRELIEKEKIEIRRTKQLLEKEQRKFLDQQKQPKVNAAVQEVPKITMSDEPQVRAFVQRRPSFLNNRTMQQRSHVDSARRRQEISSDQYQQQHNYHRFYRNHDHSPQKMFYRTNNWKDNRKERQNRQDHFGRHCAHTKVRRTSVDSPNMTIRKSTGREFQTYSVFQNRGYSQSDYDDASTSRTVTVVKGAGNNYNSGSIQDYSAYHKYDYPIIE